jgi:hypothetical protein
LKELESEKTKIADKEDTSILFRREKDVQKSSALYDERMAKNISCSIEKSHIMQLSNSIQWVHWALDFIRK